MLSEKQKILILTPVKNAQSHLDSYFRALYRLSYPHELTSIAFLESDSSDDTYARLQEKLPELQKSFRTASLWKKDFNYRIPEGMPRWAGHIQVQRRIVLAKSRNRLLSYALNDEDWVLWLDSDVIAYPPDIIQQLLSVSKDILEPNCVLKYGGRSFDLNAWRDKGKYHMHDLKKEGKLARLHAVGGTMLLVKADLHREGLIFPPFLYGKRNPLIRHHNGYVLRRTLIKKMVICLFKWIVLRDKSWLPEVKDSWQYLFKKKCYGEPETEGLGMMAYDMGYECWCMPHLEILHKEQKFP